MQVIPVFIGFALVSFGEFKNYRNTVKKIRNNSIEAITVECQKKEIINHMYYIYFHLDNEKYRCPISYDIYTELQKGQILNIEIYVAVNNKLENKIASGHVKSINGMDIPSYMLESCVLSSIP